MTELERKQKRILILCVDRDGDLTAKAEIKTPLIGRNNNLNAAVSLALKDPEEPDANAMFEAIRVYDHLLTDETKQAFEKLRRGEKLTWEEFKILAEKGLA
ncbi:DUF373 family protein [Candidatus Bathyarchaeota archaeon]|nr:DUF373 family protein [Candidatus Bathyarchaeota archaeon]